ncbi:MAG: prepilin-type N-terminal cleavage/methylation domain-containing protein [bacterium]
MNLFKKKAQNKAAFTLIEIVVVIGIMGFLTAIIYSSFDVSRAKSRDQKRISDISAIQLALEQYFQKNGVYPTTLEKLTEKLLGSTNAYINEIPKDPTTNVSCGENYFPMTKTLSSNNCISYQLWTKFELKNSYLDSKKSFNSTEFPLPNNMFECGTSHDSAKIDALADPLIYDVMP